MRSKTLVDRLAERCRDLDGDLVDLIWQACAQQDMDWIRQCSPVNYEAWSTSSFPHQQQPTVLE